MEIRGRKKGHIVILDISGNIDVDSANFVEVVGQCIREGSNDILCNFSEVELIDYMGISAIVLAYKEVVNSNGRMKFFGMPPHLKGMFSVCGLDKSIDMYLEEEPAVDSFKEDKIIEKIQKLQLRRRFKRLPIGIKVELFDKLNRNAVCLKFSILNLSATGAYIYGCDQFKLGDKIILKISIPSGNELALDARVAWLSDKEIQRQIHPGMGVEFYNITTDAQKELLDFIEKNLSRLNK